MLCIVAFIVFVILGIFSATYRRLAGEAWACVVRRVTFRPCETNFSEKVKGLLVGKLTPKSPSFARFISKFFEPIAWVLIILSIASLVYVGIAGYNLVRYQTCDPTNGNCPIGAKACANKDAGSFWAGVERLFGVTPKAVSSSQASGQPQGPETSTKLEIVEFADFQCPACGAQFAIIDKFVTDNASKVNFTFRHMPIPGHAGEPFAAAAYEAAKKQGKGTEMYRLIFKNQATWTATAKYEATFEGYAKDLGLNMDQFRTDRDSQEVKDIIEKDKQDGIKLGVQGTPSTFIEGKLSYGVVSAEDLQKALDAKVK